MKHLVASFLIFAVVLTVCFMGSGTIVCGTNKLTQKTDAVIQNVNDDNYSDALKNLNELVEFWDKTQNKFIPFINMERVDEISEKLNSMQSFCNKENKPHMLAELSSVKFLIQDLKEAEEFSIFSLV